MATLDADSARERRSWQGPVWLTAGSVHIVSMLRPHNEHWALANGLLYAALKPPLGLHHHALHLVPVAILCGVNMHLVWRRMNRTGTNAWVATASAASVRGRSAPAMPGLGPLSPHKTEPRGKRCFRCPSSPCGRTRQPTAR